MTGTFVMERAGRAARVVELVKARLKTVLLALVLLSIVVTSMVGAVEMERRIVFATTAIVAVYYLGRGWLRDPLEAHKAVADMVAGVAFGVMALFPTATCRVVDAIVLSIWVGIYWMAVVSLDTLTGWILGLPPRSV